MIRLSERLEKIAEFIRPGDRVADIGTDHGYIPIYLKQSGNSEYIIAGDINEGPLLKMQENLEKHLGEDREGIIMRLGSGLDVIDVGEVDTVVIAGMGGLLMSDILNEDIKKSRSVKRFILQPRNAQDKLRKWLINNGYRIVDEVLARESRFVWEIICAEPVNSMEGEELIESTDSHSISEDKIRKLHNEYFNNEAEQYEVGQWIIKKKDPLISEFINNKLSIERKIVENAGKSLSKDAIEQRKAAINKIEMLEGILKNVNK